MTQAIQGLPRPVLFALLGVLAAIALLFATRRGGEEATAPAPPAVNQATGTATGSGTQSGSQSQSGAQGQQGQQSGTPEETAKAKPRGLPSDVERALDAKKVVAVLFYNPRSPDDLSVKRDVEAIPSRGGKVATFTDTLENVYRYTRLTGSQGVTTTPTLVVVDERGNGRMGTGFNDEATVDQLVVDALR
jgi:hypothetical protein